MNDAIPAAFISNRWICAAQQQAAVLSPITEKPISRVQVDGSAYLDDALESAATVQGFWAATSLTSRATLLRRLAEKLASFEDEIAECLVQEIGTPIRSCKEIHIRPAVTEIGLAAHLVTRLDPYRRSGRTVELKSSIGTIGCITSWNYPVRQIASKLASALAAGCCVVLRPSARAPRTAALFANIVSSCDLPDGVFSVVIDLSNKTIAKLVRDPRVAGLSVTGSSAFGKVIYRAAPLKRVVLELGGKSAAIVLPNGKALERSLRGILRSLFANNGQSCSASTRIFVHESDFAEAVRILPSLTSEYIVGDPRHSQTGIGPLISKEDRIRVTGMIADAMHRGATPICGGTHFPSKIIEGHYLSPTILTGASNGDPICQEEIFGPVGCLLSYSSVDEAVRACNDVRYGLTSEVWGDDVLLAEEVAARLEVGQVSINGHWPGPAFPFGGWKDSGIGYERGIEGISAFLQRKVLQLGTSSQ
jgi:aldehyde dehydrogenase (NAD+)